MNVKKELMRAAQDMVTKRSISIGTEPMNAYKIAGPIQDENNGQIRQAKTT